MTKSMGPKLLIPIARALGKRHLDETQLNALLDALDLADIVKDDRDFIAHGSWGTLMPDDVPCALSIRPSVQEGGKIAMESFPGIR